jgi:DNA primase
MTNLDLIDTKSLLDGEEIEYTDKGKNVSSGWIGIDCPFCHDSSHHCGINISTNLFYCWVCAEKGNIVRLIKEIKQIPYRKAELIITKYTREDIYNQTSEQNPTQPNVCRPEGQRLVWPSPIVDSPPPMHRQYLKSRRFDPDLLTKKYKLRFTPNVGKHRFCIIAPIIMNGKVMSWIAADVIRDGGRPPYIKCPTQSSMLAANSCLYNVDSVGSAVVLVEGITDVWRCGDGFVATMTKSITPEQILVLVQKNVKKVFVMFDSDALNQSQEVAKKLSGLFDTEVVELTEGDPADMSSLEVAEARRLLL